MTERKKRFNINFSTVKRKWPYFAIGIDEDKFKWVFWVFELEVAFGEK